MTTKSRAAKSEAPATIDAGDTTASPAAGGSYIRREDGSLERVEFTAPPTAPGEDGAEPAPESASEAGSDSAAAGEEG